ncbi:MAG: hypothetical protein BM556_06040 [Bacteriovorax sp. MedPE-SWde]|nr:MAG: hypothetical protein BM556_06040 [Bacteriovorax sp. MedPE-SWde]
MSERQSKATDGITLKMMLTDVIDLFGFKDLYEMTEIRSFDDDHPQFNKILKFIRKNEWAKDKIEKMYRGNLGKIAAMRREQERNQRK